MKEYTLCFTIEDLRALNVAIGELPTKVGVPLYTKINEQIAKQKTEDAPFGVGSVPATSMNTGK